jgi:ubiquinone/menaquinone biosynthesis C-methylase UbiE
MREMEKDEYTIMHDIEQTYWWFVGKQFLVKRTLERLFQDRRGGDRILDIGCGTGIILKLLENFGTSYGVELSRDAVQFLRNRGLNLIVQSDANRSIPFKDNTFSAITCLDVLEHLDNDLKLLKEMRRVCKQGGYVIVTVPAFGILWSSHDVALHHKRRYTRELILQKIRGLGYTVLKASYYNVSLFFPILVVRKLKLLFSSENHVRSDFFLPIPNGLNALLSSLFIFEIGCLRFVNFLFGVSLVLVLQKHNGR